MRCLLVHTSLCRSPLSGVVYGAERIRSKDPEEAVARPGRRLRNGLLEDDLVDPSYAKTDCSGGNVKLLRQIISIPTDACAVNSISPQLPAVTESRVAPYLPSTTPHTLCFPVARNLARDTPTPEELILKRFDRLR